MLCPIINKRAQYNNNNNNNKNSQVERPVNRRVDGANDEKAEQHPQWPHRAHQVPRVVGVGACDAVVDAEGERPDLQDSKYVKCAMCKMGEITTCVGRRRRGKVDLP